MASAQGDAFCQRFWSKVRKMPNGCWVWTAGLNKGYGKFRMPGHRGKWWKAHRLALALSGYPAPKKPLEIDHTCRNKACVNPAHLEVVTHQENMLRVGKGDRWRCRNGHLRPPTGGKCLQCRREWDRKQNAKSRVRA